MVDFNTKKKKKGSSRQSNCQISSVAWKNNQNVRAEESLFTLVFANIYEKVLPVSSLAFVILIPRSEMTRFRLNFYDVT